MSNVFVDLKYIEYDEWICVEVDGMLIIGIIDFVQDVLGDIVFLELLDVGCVVVKDEVIVVVELVKVVFDIYVFVLGEIIVNNVDVVGVFELVNVGVYEVWLFKIKLINVDDVNVLMLVEQYVVKIG